MNAAISFEQGLTISPVVLRQGDDAKKLRKSKSKRCFWIQNTDFPLNSPQASVSYTHLTEAIRRSGPITRSQIMELYGQTKSAAYQRLRAMLDKGLLVRVGYKYYLPDSVVPPERQQEALYEYLKKEGFACRKDITTTLQIETEQCSALLLSLIHI